MAHSPALIPIVQMLLTLPDTLISFAVTATNKDYSFQTFSQLPVLAVLNVVRSKFVELSHVSIWVEYAMRIEDSRWSCDLDEMSLGDGLSHPNPLGGLKSGRFIRIRQDVPPTHFNPLFHRDPRRKHLL